MVNDIVTKGIDEITMNTSEAVQNLLHDLETKFENSVIPLADYEARIASIRETNQHKLIELNASIAQNKQAFKDFKAKSELAKKVWEDKYAECKKKLIKRNEIIEDLTIKQDKYIKELQAKNTSTNQSLENRAIRDKFDEALKNTKRELDIFSPWVSENVVDWMMIDKFRALLEKGVTIKIRYGIGDLSANAINQKNRNDYTAETIKALKKEFKLYPNFKVYKDNSHAKLFICDDDYYVISSFNILSFSGDYKGLDQRRELGELSHNKELLNAYRNHYFNF